MATTYQESMSALRREIDRNRQRERQGLRTKLQHVYSLSPEQAAIQGNHRCPHCGEYLIPWKGLDEWRGNEKWFWPDEHNCEAERIAREQQEKDRIVAEETREQREYNQRLKDAGLIGWLSGATFAAFSARDDWAGAEDAWQRVMCYAKAVEAGNCEKPFLLLCGEVGNGKSHLAAAVVHYFLDKGHRPCYFRVWPDYLKRITATFGRKWDDSEDDHETEEDIIGELQLGKVAVIDDLDKRKPTDWVRETLFPVMNYRYNAGLPTILTLNYGPRDKDQVAPGRLALEAYLGRAVLDRVIGAAFDLIEFNGPSYRSGLDYKE